MRHILLVFSLFLTIITYSQKYVSETAHVWFRAEPPFHDIEAHNKQVNAVLKTKSGTIAFTVCVKSFIFKKELMQDRFNANFIESDKYPDATFKGKVVNINTIDFTKPGTYDAEISGKISIHGITRQINLSGVFEVKPGMIHGKSKFYILTSDYDIIFSGLLAGNLAIKIEINVDVQLETYPR